MTNHQNRNRAGSGAVYNPTPAQVIALRKRHGYTQSEAAKRWMVTLSTVQKWEAPDGTQNHRRVQPLIWWAIQERVKFDVLDFAD